MEKSLTTFLTIIDTDFPIAGNYCVLYKDMYLYFFKNFKNTLFSKTIKGYYDYVYLVFVVSKLPKDITWEKASFFLRSWTLSNEHKIQFSYIMSLIPVIGYEEFLRYVYFPPDQAKKYKTAREKTEFEIIAINQDKTTCTQSCKSEGDEELLRLYSVATSDTNVYSQILFLVHTITYPDKEDTEKFINFVDTFFEKISNKDIPSHLANEIKKIKKNKSFGDIEKFKTPNGNISYGSYFYKSIRNSIAHIVRLDSNDSNEKTACDKQAVNIKIDDFNQTEVLRSVANILNEIAYSKLTEEISGSLIQDDECCLIELPNIQNIAELTLSYLDGLFELSRLEEMINNQKIQGNLTKVKHLEELKNFTELCLKKRIQMLTQNN